MTKKEEPQPMGLPPAAQQMLMQLQTFQQQYQTAAMQRETLAVQKLEVEKALDELSKTDDKQEVFKAAGPLLIKSTKADLTKDLTEKKETIETRLKSVEERTKKTREKMDEIQTKLQSLLAGKEKQEAG